MRALRYALLLLGVYMLSWTAAYLLVMVLRGGGWDFGHYFEYLILAWTFRGGELPTFIWFFSLAGFLIVGTLTVVFMWRNEKR